ncbi:extracellular solute-binding protein [Paraburkholderia sp. Cy-641]|nr:extracellular solute-binding protein [Paraburkholderia sp. Cy-641]
METKIVSRSTRALIQLDRAMPRRDALRHLAALAISIASGGLTAKTALAASPYASPPSDGPGFSMRVATTYAGAEPLAKPFTKVLNEFQRDYPNIKLIHEATPGFDHQTKIKLDALSDRLPDVFTFWRLDPSYGLDQIAEAGRLADLTAWSQNDPFFKGLFDDSSWDTATRKGVVYGIPAQMFYIWLLVNRKILDRAKVPVPTTWDELVAAGPRLRAAGEIPWSINNGNDSMAARVYNYVMSRCLGNERAVRIHGGLEPADSPDMIRASTLVQQLLGGNIPSDGITLSSDLVYAKYTNTEKAAFLIDASFRLFEIDPKIAGDLQVLNFPAIPDGVQHDFRVERDLTSLWYASSKQYADAARRPYIQEFIRRMTNRQTARYFTETAKVQMPQLDLEVDPAAVGQLSVETLKAALAAPGNKWVPKLMKPAQRTRYEPLMSEFIEGKYTPQEYVAKFAEIMRS